VGSFDDGNKSRIISNRDQKKGQIPSRIMLRLTRALWDGCTDGRKIKMPAFYRRHEGAVTGDTHESSIERR
jgi:hypothetical protein